MPCHRSKTESYLMAEKGDPYLLFVSMAFESREVLDRYLAAVQQVVMRHDILRTSVVWKNLSVPAQVVWRDAPLQITEVQLNPADGPVDQQLKRMFDPVHFRIDLTQAPLLRFVIAQESDGRWILVELLHHLIGDHTTVETMAVEIHAFFERKGATLASAHPYRNLIAQARLGTSQESHERFFMDILADVDTSSLPFGLSNVHSDGSQIAELYRILPQDLNNRLSAQAKRVGVSLASLCHVAWAQVVARTSGQKRVVFGIVLFGRMQVSTSTDRAMGLFMNTLPLRVDVDASPVEDIVRATHSKLAALLEHEHASLALAQRCSSVTDGQPLFSSLLNYRHNSSEMDTAQNISGMRFLETQERTNYPFVLSVEDFGSELGLTVQVTQEVDCDRVWGYMQQALESLAQALNQEPNTPVKHLEVLPTEERTMLLQSWNTVRADYPEQPCLHQLFEKLVERTPNATAIVHEDQILSYTEVNTRASGIAHHLIKLGVKPDSPVAICVERSPAMIIGLLATLKAGGAYVPLDPAHGSERLLDILSDASPSIILADTVGRSTLGQEVLVSLMTVDPNWQPEGSVENPHVPTLSMHHLAYVIYTSGSTGRPKGVMIEHHQVTRLFDTTATWYGFHDRDTWCVFHSFAFDVSVWEIWGGLRYGGKLVLVSQDIVRSPQDMYRLLCEQAVTVLSMTPSAFRPIIECHDREGVHDSLRYVILAGETLNPAMLEPWYATHTETKPQVVNMYGATETTVHSTYRPMTLGDCSHSSSLIGVRYPDTRTYILDDQGLPVPLGAIGELYLGGAGVARGYLNRPELSAERFLQDPFAEGSVSKMYRTGYLARFLPDGNLVYLGRNDHQVKIRGFRIELSRRD